MLALLGLAALPSVAATAPASFVIENEVPGVFFEIPTAIAFLPGGRMLVAEKRGQVWAVSHGIRHPTPLWERESEVLNETDRGLLAIAVDPNYVNNHFIYLLYTVDPDSNGVDDNDDAFGRLARYTVSFTDSNKVDYASRTILFGASWGEGPCVASPSHTVGDLEWGADGSLLVSIGDGANIAQADAGGMDPALFAPGRTNPLEDIGAFRSQWIGSLAGKVLRIDPATGHGYPSNPFWDGNPGSVGSRVWCYGLRNPFRITVRPGTGTASPEAADPGTLFLGDVGWNQWEELNITADGGRNFGWPCWEGPAVEPHYQAANPAHHGCDSIGLGDNTGPLTGPVVTYHHSIASLSIPPGLVGNTVVGGVFYTAATYPALYRGRYFFADYGSDWIKFAEVDGSDEIVSISSFQDEAGGPVDLETDPVTGDILYVAIYEGEVRRIRWAGPVGSNLPPVVTAAGFPTSGIVPTTVAFSSAGTYDPDLDPLTFYWNFGDGVGSSDPNPSHTYLTGGAYAVVLTVTDGQGGVTRDTVQVSILGGAGAFPSTPVLDDFNRPSGALGPKWGGEVLGAIIRASTATATCCEIAPLWVDAAFGPFQEVHARLTTLQLAPLSLLLKVQGADRSGGYLAVSYYVEAQRILVVTAAPGQALIVRAELPASLVNGDWLGARAWPNGSVEVYRNGVRIGVASMGDWPFAAQGGRIGFVLDAEPPPRIDDFGGGDIVLNTAPSAAILAPADSSFYVEGETLNLWGRGVDVEQQASTLDYDWRLDLHHGGHVHPGSFVATGTTASYTLPNHEDGTGVWYEINFRVTDSGGLVGTDQISIFPEVDLLPGPVEVIPTYPGTTAPAEYRFRIHNPGRMRAPTSHWQLVANDIPLAEGDAQVPALDSIQVALTLPPTLTPGPYTLRVVVDTLGGVVETHEANNARNRPLTVVPGPGTVDAPLSGVPATLALSSAYPSPSTERTSFTLDLPRSSRVSFSVHDLQGRRVWGQPERVVEAGRQVLTWDGGRELGGRAATGLYLARVVVDGQPLVRPIALLR